MFVRACLLQALVCRSEDRLCLNFTWFLGGGSIVRFALQAFSPGEPSSLIQTVACLGLSLKLNAVSVSLPLGVFPFGVSLYVTSYCNNNGVNSIYSKLK